MTDTWRYFSIPFLLLGILTVYILSAASARAPALTAQTDVIIVSPHPDDAVLCCAGIIQQRIAQGKSVGVVTVTSGDAYLGAASAWFNIPEKNLTGSDMRKFGLIRNREDIHALSLLGVERKNMAYLGYPDGLLDQIYEADKPVTSPYTGNSRPQGNKTASYTKQSLLREISDAIQRTNPKEIFVSAPEDEALDHRVTHWFVRDALEAIGYSGTVYTYKIHAASESATLPETAMMTHMLSPDQNSVKRKAIGQYATQLKVDSDYLGSFAGSLEQYQMNP